MPTVPTHALVATTIFGCVGQRDRSWTARLWVLGAICSMLPDLDVVGFSFGVRYGDLIGHRGLSHSLFFAAAVAAIVVEAARPRDRLAAWWFLFACTASHGLLDAATDGGLGVAFFSPFSNERYFWLWRPIRVAPIGLTRIFSGRGREVLLSEIVWIWVPCAIVLAVVAVRRRRAWRAAAERGIL